MSLKEHLREKFVYVDEVAEILQIGSLTNKNVFLYGRGGHAKSEIIEQFLKYLDRNGNESFVQACGEGLTEDKLFGGIDMKEFQKTGEIKHLVQNSFMNKKYVVFEELLDSRMNVLLSLKDILTSGWFRQGKQQFKIRTEFIICLTNRTKQEVSEDNSIKALLERFPLEMKVEWPKYENEDYQNMFVKVLKNNYHEVAQVCQLINESGDFVSPRTAIHMAQVYAKTNNLIDLKYFGATADIIAKMEKKKREKELKEFLSLEATKLNNIINNLDSSSSESLKSSIMEVKDIVARIGSKTYPDTIYSDYSSLRDLAERSIVTFKDKIVNLFIDG